MSREVAETENVHTHPTVVELVDFQASCDTDTRAHSHFIFCNSPSAEHKTSQLVAISHPVCTVTQHKAIYWCCYTAPHSAHILPPDSPASQQLQQY